MKPLVVAGPGADCHREKKRVWRWRSPNGTPGENHQTAIPRRSTAGFDIGTDKIAMADSPAASRTI